MIRISCNNSEYFMNEYGFDEKYKAGKIIKELLKSKNPKSIALSHIHDRDLYPDVKKSLVCILKGEKIIKENKNAYKKRYKKTQYYTVTLVC
jgi:hypothetical protein